MRAGGLNFLGKRVFVNIITVFFFTFAVAFFWVGLVVCENYLNFSFCEDERVKF